MLNLQKNSGDPETLCLDRLKYKFGGSNGQDYIH